MSNINNANNAMKHLVSFLKSSASVNVMNAYHCKLTSKEIKDLLPEEVSLVLMLGKLMRILSKIE